MSSYWPQSEGEPRNHGKTWTPEDLKGVRTDYLRGMHIFELMEKYGRTRVSIESKLTKFAIGTSGPYGPTVADVCPQKFQDAYQKAITVKPTTGIEKETTMKIVIEDKKFINGTDISTMSEEDFFGLISRAGNEIKSLEAIQPRPNALQRRINSLNASVAQLVELCDERFPG